MYINALCAYVDCNCIIKKRKGITMEITLEKIELVKDRTGVGYKEAKEALEQTEGNVVDAIILIEENIDEAGRSKVGAHGAAAVDSIKEAIRKGNVSKIVIKKDGDVLLNLPVNIGIIGTVLFPWAALGATIAAFGTKCTIELIKDKLDDFYREFSPDLFKDKISFFLNKNLL